MAKIRNRLRLYCMNYLVFNLAGFAQPWLFAIGIFYFHHFRKWFRTFTFVRLYSYYLFFAQGLLLLFRSVPSVFLFCLLGFLVFEMFEMLPEVLI